MNTLKTILLVFVLIFTTACSMNNRFVNAFEGPDKSPEQIARLRLDADLNVTKVSGGKVEYFAFSNGSSYAEIRFLPGVHEFQVGVLRGAIHTTGSIPFTFNAQAGHRYRLKYGVESDKAGGRYAQPYVLDVTDTETWQ